MKNNVSIISILENLHDYVILKRWPNFPDFTPGDDLDVLVLDKHQASRKLFYYLMQDLDGVKRYLDVSEGNHHIHIDIMSKRGLILRIDLIDEFLFYTKFSVQNSLKTKIFMTRETVDYEGYDVFVPSTNYELLIRYFEYLEWFERRPDKLKHLDFILKNTNEKDKQQLIENAHRYIRFHHEEWQEDTARNVKPISSRKQAVKEIFYLLRLIVRLTFSPIIKTRR